MMTTRVNVATSSTLAIRAVADRSPEVSDAANRRAAGFRRGFAPVASHAVAALSITALVAASGCRPAPTIVTTSIAEADCHAPAAELMARYAEKELGVQQCPGAGGWDVYVVSSDTNSWIELRSSTITWSSEVPIVYDMPIGLFPGVQSDAPLEWRVGSGIVRALLFTVSAQDPADAETRVRQVYVARFTEDGVVCVIGREDTIEEARDLADSDTTCPEI